MKNESIFRSYGKDAFDASSYRVAEAVQKHYEREQSTNMSEEEKLKSRVAAAEKVFLNELTEMMTDPKFNSSQQEFTQATLLLSGMPITGPNTWAGMLSRISQQFRLPPENREELRNKFFPQKES